MKKTEGLASYLLVTKREASKQAGATKKEKSTNDCSLIFRVTTEFKLHVKDLAQFDLKLNELIYEAIAA